MTHYRRFHTADATAFFTANLAERNANPLLVDHIDSLRSAIAKVKTAHPFRIDAMVVLPDHLHAIWTLPPGDADFATRWGLIKANFSRGLPRVEHRSASRRARGERHIWQRRFWEHVILSEADLFAHLDYIHYNPVKHGHAQQVSDWPFSTFHRFVARGWYAADWGVQRGNGLEED